MTVNPAGSFGHVPGGGGGGGTVTVIAAVPLWPSLVAVIVAAPTATPLTNPLPFTVATPALPLPHVTTRPVSAAPLASLRVTVSCPVCPTGMLAVAGVTVTDATGAGEPVVVPFATFESALNTAFTFSVPRNAISWN